MSHTVLVVVFVSHSVHFYFRRISLFQRFRSYWLIKFIVKCLFLILIWLKVLKLLWQASRGDKKWKKLIIAQQ